MQEIELRFQIPADQRAPLLSWLRQAGALRSERLQAAYFDTPARDLARAGFALRLRREGRRWVQTLKGDAPDGMTRLEHNVALGQGATMPALDVARHAGHPAGDALLARVAELGGEAALQCLFRTDIRRRSALLTQGDSVLELALDAGHLLADADGVLRETPVHELEIELKSGVPAAVLQLAHQLVPSHGLWLEQRTKALRGDLLARGLTEAAPAFATPAPWPRGCSAAQALQLLLRAALGPVLGNASQIASGSHAAEHLHQLRVALLRLAVGLQLLQGMGGRDGWPQGALLDMRRSALALRRQLSLARDADALAASPWQASLDAAWQATGLSDDALTAPPEPAHCSPADLLRSGEAQSLMLALLERLTAHAGLAGQACLANGSSALKRSCQGRLKRWQKALHEAGKHIAPLTAAERHRLRQRLRRLRYALEQTAELLPQPKAARQMHGLKQLHQQLGELNDLEHTLQQARQRAAEPAVGQRQLQAAFALGFLHAKQALRLRKADASWLRWRKHSRG